MTYKITNISGTVINIRGRDIAAGESILTNNLTPYRKALYSGLLTLKENDNEIQVPTENDLRKIRQKTHRRLKDYFNNVVLDVNNQYDKYVEQVKSSQYDSYQEQDQSISQEEKSNDEELIAALQDHLNYNLLKLEDKLRDELIQKTLTKPTKNKEEILTSLFHFFIDRKINDKDLNNIKKFYNDIHVTSLLDEKTKRSLDNVTNYEELVTVLLNNVYPNLFN